jgi:hypothetical protein
MEMKAKGMATFMGIWMHRSTYGLEAISNLILLGYTEEERYRKFRDKMLNSDRNVIFPVVLLASGLQGGVLTDVGRRPKF